MNFLVILAVAALMVTISWFLWKSGFLTQAEKPEALIDKPVMEAKERRAIIKRLKRWRAEGKITREEFEHVSDLCRSEWDVSEE